MTRNRQAIALIVGAIVGCMYYEMMRSTIKMPYKNCSFVSSVLTDVLAFIVGAIILYKGWVLDELLLTACGIAITVEHILQFSYKSV